MLGFERDQAVERGVDEPLSFFQGLLEHDEAV
jgi:hypothetical protein